MQIFNFFQAWTSERCGLDGGVGGWGLIHKRSLAPTPPATVGPLMLLLQPASTICTRQLALGLQCLVHFSKTKFPKSRVQSWLAMHLPLLACLCSAAATSEYNPYSATGHLQCDEFLDFLGWYKTSFSKVQSVLDNWELGL